MQSRMQPQMQSQGLTLPVEAEVGPSVAHVDDVSLGNDQVKLGVEEVQDVDAHVLVPTQEVQLVG